MHREDKPFRTIDEQVAILEGRGMVIDDHDSTREFLLRHNYYSVVNGYKEFFLDPDRCNGQVEVYREGTRFEDLSTLYTFDTVLRFSLTPCLLSAEKAMKTVTVHAFCDKHRSCEDYLDPACYCPMSEYGRKNYTRNLIRMLSILQNLHDGVGGDRPYIKHYRDNHQGVPLWVLANALTFGNMSHFYDLQTISVKNEACHLLCQTIGAQKLGARRLGSAYSTLVGFRNVCAHGERLFCAKTGPRGDRLFSNMLEDLFLVSTESEAALAVRAVVSALNMLEPMENLREMAISSMGLGGKAPSSVRRAFERHRTE